MMRVIYFGLLLASCTILTAAESVWIEAEHLQGVRGSCFPDMKGNTAGHWGLSGPGIAPEWTQGGESEWLSIACGPDDDKAAATYDLEMPEAGEWRLWARYRDWRRQTEIFAVRVEQAGQPPQTVTFGEQPRVDEEDELKLLWKWAFAWDMRSLKLAKGPAKVTLLAHVKQAGHRQVDCLCLTTDAAYTPYLREKPRSATWKTLDELRGRLHAVTPPLAARTGESAAPVAWKPATFRDKGFLYLWNVGKSWEDELNATSPQRMLVPFHTDAPLVEEFRKQWGGKTDVPIFGDPRIVPTFHGAGPQILGNEHFVKWLEAHPDRAWANMMNYTDAKPLSDRAKANWAKYRERYAGNIAGESLGYFNTDTKALHERIKTAKTRGEILDAMTEMYMAGSQARHKILFGETVADHYLHTIPCPSVEMTASAHFCREWGARTMGYENSAVIPSLAMRMGFLRGSARQYGGMMADYRSCNFGDAATIYANQGYFYAGSPRYVYDNSYDVWAGAGMTWYKFDIWNQYMSGSAMFYHEQGHDEFWQPGGNSVAPGPLQLSPKGRLIEQFLEVTRRHPDRGAPWTPIAFLLDRAHGWDPNGYQPAYFGHDVALNPALLSFGRHARMLKEWFRVAYHPYGPQEAAPNTGVNQISMPGVFGDIFDVLVTSPTKLDAVDDYPVVVLNGEVALTEAWGKKLAAYLERGGTVMLCDNHVSGPGAAHLKLPVLGAPAEDASFQWLPVTNTVASQRFRYRPIQGGRPLAKATNGDTLAATFEYGKGRLVFISIPNGLGVDSAAVPLVPLALAQARAGLMPVEVDGEVEWMLNRTGKGWVVTLFNPAGSAKPQHGVVPTDHSQKRDARIHAAAIGKAIEWFSDAALPIAQIAGRQTLQITVPAGGVRIIELQ
ncbi:MAG: hypothetical protein EXS22_06415 [Pedosphaera sp.]|nr:hypothetical protein [Pedosphaera sp.]